MNPLLKNAVIVDLDNTLMFRSKDKDGNYLRGWREEHLMESDVPSNLLNLINFLKEDIHLIFISGSREYARINYINWFKKYLSPNLNYELFLRNNDDWRKGFEVKKDIYLTYVKEKFNVLVAFDDDPDICKMYKEEGILSSLICTRGVEKSEINSIKENILEISQQQSYMAQNIQFLISKLCFMTQSPSPLITTYTPFITTCNSKNESK